MLKKFFSITLLLTVCAVAQASQTAPAKAVVPATTAVVTVPVSAPAPVVAPAPVAEVKKSVEAAPAAEAKPACTESTCSKAKTAVCNAFTTAKNAVVGHPYISAGVTAAVAAVVAYNSSETVRGWFGVSSDDASKCPCTKRDQLSA